MGKRFGWIGLGRMGEAVVKRLLNNVKMSDGLED